MQVAVYLLERLFGTKPIFYRNFAICGAPIKVISNKWKSIKVSITLGFLHKLIKRHNLVNAAHEHDLLWQFLNTVFTKAITPNVNKAT